MSTNTTKNRFNAAAAAWDSNPDVHRASALALSSLLQHVPELRTHAEDHDRDADHDSLETNATPGLDVLEIGCGTGLLSFTIAPYVRSLVAVDSAQGMIDALRAKLERRPEVRNILPVCAELEDPDDVRIRADPLGGDRGLQDREANSDGPQPRRFDLVISHLVLHHIPLLENMFVTMHGCLKPGGRVALTDYEDFGPAARKFHPEGRMEGVERHGIRRGVVREQLAAAGFVDVRIETAFEMEKGVETRPGEGIGKGENGSTMVFPFLICIATKG